MDSVKRTISFRTDINGLRAWAVMAVLFFHFKVMYAGGGFVGVDIFFVISGFLMTSIIVKGLEAGNFSIWEFYMARARRIVPALALLTMVLLVLGWFLLPTFDYKTLGSQAVGALSFLSNIYYFKHSGYFDSDAHEKWLLHTWSLSVEWQFYMLFPIFLLLVWRLKGSLYSVLLALLAVLIISLGVSILYSSSHPNAAFYLLPTRGWEMASGGIVYVLSRINKLSDTHRTVALYFGWLIVVFSILFMPSNAVWPGHLAVLPVLGACLILMANTQDSAFSNHPTFQWIGDRSYSIYLWHWPLVVGLYFANLNESFSWVVASLLLSLVLGHFSYLWAEIPARNYFRKLSFFREVGMTGLMVLCIACCAISARLFVFDGRLPLKADLAANEASNTEPRRNECHYKAGAHGSPACVYGSGKVGALLVGDSHAASVITAIAEAGEKYDSASVLLSSSLCQQLDEAHFLDEAGKEDSRCSEFNTAISENINSYSPDVPLVLLSRLNVRFFGFNEKNKQHLKQIPRVYFSEPYHDPYNPKFQKEFKDAIVGWACKFTDDREVYLVRPIPEITVNVPNTLSRNIIFGRGEEDIKISTIDYKKRNQLIWQAQDEAVSKCGVKILNPLSYLCDDDFCYGSKNGVPRYTDDDHLSESGNKLLVPMFAKVFDKKREM